MLNQRKIGIKFSVIDGGISGIQTPDIVDNLESTLNLYHPDMVITMMGINDFGSYMPHEDPSDAKAMRFWKSFRVYRLIRLLALHMATRWQALKLDGVSRRTSSGLGAQGRPQCVGGNFDNARAYVQLARCYRQNGSFSEAEALLRRAIELNPDINSTYVELGELYRVQKKDSEFEAFLRKAIELDANNYAAYVYLAWLCQENRKTADAETILRKVIARAPKNVIAYIHLGEMYLSQGRFLEAELLFKQAIELAPADYRAYGSLKVLYTAMGNLSLANDYDMKAQKAFDYPLMTTGNYHKLKVMLDKRRIKYVCMQYPVRNISSLNKIFEGHAGGIVFIDNERLFKDVLQKGDYKDYFIDLFGGDFGHCTKKGNALLAAHMADVISNEVFHQ
ncbi:MAG: tetratricopeptide repeat protein [Candidatus Omnitrophica bacterium]|nr:tetratricopeptide repeat protein [Candidatus Omnitrophota bacterium]